jgi:hypothetical protein
MEKKEKGAGEYNITIKKEKFFIFCSSADSREALMGRGNTLS